MTEMNFSDAERRAINDSGVRTLQGAIEECLKQKSWAPIYKLGLNVCEGDIEQNLKLFHRYFKEYVKDESPGAKAIALKAGEALVVAFKNAKRILDSEPDE